MAVLKTLAGYFPTRRDLARALVDTRHVLFGSARGALALAVVSAVGGAIGLTKLALRLGVALPFDVGDRWDEAAGALALSSVVGVMTFMVQLDRASARNLRDDLAATVVRNLPPTSVLEQHHEAMKAVIARLVEEIGGPAPITRSWLPTAPDSVRLNLQEMALFTALREHTPDEGFWPLFDRWGASLGEYTESRRAHWARVSAAIGQDFVRRGQIEWALGGLMQSLLSDEAQPALVLGWETNQDNLMFKFGDDSVLIARLKGERIGREPVSAPTPEEITELQRRVEQLARDICDWPESKEFVCINLDMRAQRQPLLNAATRLSLLPWLTGTCDLCRGEIRASTR